MVDLRTVVIVAMFMALIVGVGGHRHGEHREGPWHGHGGRHHGSKPCTQHPFFNPFLPPCDMTPVDGLTTASPPEETTTITVSESEINAGQVGKINIGVSAEFGAKLSKTEYDQWCRLANGTYIVHGQIFMDHLCKMCQCKDSRAILCDIFQCMPTYCVDNKRPIRRDDQCCTQCESDVPTQNCVHNGISYPHGAIMKVVPHKMTCWCQLGHVECRNYMGSMFEGFNPFANGLFLYVIILVILIPICFGFFLCCSCSLVIYYYIQRHQTEFQQTYDQYVNGTGGWQPIIEEEQYLEDAIAENKKAEAEKSQSEAPVYDIPPPYAIYDDTYAPVDDPKKA